MPDTNNTPRTWILTGSRDNYGATKERNFEIIGLKERRLKQAQDIEPNDRIIFYLTGVMAFAAAVTVTSEMFEDRTPIWPATKGRADLYPWRFDTKRGLVLDEEDWLAAERLKDRLEHIQKWPSEHWKLAFQGQIRDVSDSDADLLLAEMRKQASA